MHDFMFRQSDDNEFSRVSGIIGPINFKTMDSPSLEWPHMILLILEYFQMIKKIINYFDRMKASGELERKSLFKLKLNI